MVPIIAIFLWLLPVWAQATTYYVATTGNDANSGTSEDAPLLTFRAGIAKLAAGDTLYIRSGTYNESTYVRLSVNGTEASPIKIMAYPGEAPVVNFTNQTAGTFFLLQRSPGHNLPIGWITIEGITWQGGYSAIKWYNALIARYEKINSTILGGAPSSLMAEPIISSSGTSFSILVRPPLGGMGFTTRVLVGRS